jgi:Mg-chelatase subunit ChlI
MLGWRACRLTSLIEYHGRLAGLCAQEGELRPQLLDRFGMSVNVTTMQNIAARTQMVLDRMAFEKVEMCICELANDLLSFLLLCHID